MEGQIQTTSSSDEANEERTNVTGSIMFHMSLNETACIKLETNASLPGHVGTSSILHSVEFLRLEHHYSITGKYLFGIPSISFDCKCDCAGGDPICTFEEYYHKNCTSSTAPLCYTSFLPFQSNHGCFSSQPSAVCCKMSIRPHENWMFQAITISQPSTILVLRYRIFEKLNRGWKKSVDEKIKVSLNSGGAKYDLNQEHSIEIIASGSRPHRQLEPGNYFWQLGTSANNEKPQLRGKIAINDFNETSLEKLGWFRMEGNVWTIKNGLGRMPKAQHIQVKDCKAQNYLTTLDAEQFVLEGSEDKILNYNLGSAIIDDPWVGGIEIGNRAITVNHAEGTSLLLTLKAKSQPRAVHHISQFSTFNGSIQLDKESNRFLNLTFLDTRGTLIGQVFSSESRAQMDIVFSIQTSENVEDFFKAIVSLPSTIDSRRYICIHASGDLDSQQCQWLEYKADPLNENRIRGGFIPYKFGSSSMV
uniref:Uncharacterized protein n=1 Tax=Panagrolaimus superbus TaxID=310955 RepID=A0A914YER7_9BILA